MNDNVTMNPTGGKRIGLLPTLSITTALSGTTPGLGGANGVQGISGAKSLVAQSVFVYGSGGTTAKAYIQTSLDNGTTWFDIISHAFATTTATKVSGVTSFIAPASQGFAPSDAALSDNTIIQGVIGDRVRLKLTTVGTYAATTLKIDLIAKG